MVFNYLTLIKDTFYFMKKMFISLHDRRKALIYRFIVVMNNE